MSSKNTGPTVNDFRLTRDKNWAKITSENENILDQDGGDNEERELEEDNALPFQEPPHNLDMIDEQLNLFQKLKTELG